MSYCYNRGNGDDLWRDMRSVLIVRVGQGISHRQTIRPLVRLALAPRPRLGLALGQIGSQGRRLPLFLLLLAQLFARNARRLTRFYPVILGCHRPVPIVFMKTPLIAEIRKIRKHKAHLPKKLTI